MSDTHQVYQSKSGNEGMSEAVYCRTCEGYHRDWWKRNLLYHVAMSIRLAALIVRKPWHEKTDEPFANIHWSLAWEVARDIHWKKGARA